MGLGDAAGLSGALPLPLIGVPKGVPGSFVGVLNGVGVKNAPGAGVDSREGPAKLCTDDARECVRARVRLAEEDARKRGGGAGTSDHPKREARRDGGDGRVV
jgi:hypothetical protein